MTFRFLLVIEGGHKINNFGISKKGQEWKTKGVSKKNMLVSRKPKPTGDVSGCLNHAKVQYCCSKTRFSQFGKMCENKAKGIPQVIQRHVKCVLRAVWGGFLRFGEVSKKVDF